MYFIRRALSQTTIWCRCYATLNEKAKFKVEDPKYLYEPKIENTRKFPDCNVINVRLQSYDFVPLEKFQAYVHKIARRFKFKVLDSYAVAAQTQKVVTFKPNSSIVDSELNLIFYDRWIRLDEVPAIHLPLFLQIIQAHIPIGVKLTVKDHEKSDENYRYIPDLLLIEKQKELKSLDNPSIRKLLGWE